MEPVSIQVLPLSEQTFTLLGEGDKLSRVSGRSSITQMDDKNRAPLLFPPRNEKPPSSTLWRLFENPRDFTIYPGIARKRGPATQKFYNSRAREPLQKAYPFFVLVFCLTFLSLLVSPRFRDNRDTVDHDDVSELRLEFEKEQSLWVVVFVKFIWLLILVFYWFEIFSFISRYVGWLISW